MRRLVRNVYDGRTGYGPAFGNADSVPEDVAARITEPSAWEGDQAPHTQPVESPGSEEAPGSGTDRQSEVLRRPAGNASQEAWFEFRAAQGVPADVLVDMTRNELRDMEH